MLSQTIRKKLVLEPKTKLLVYAYHAVILKKLEVPDIAKDLETMCKRIDRRLAKYGKLMNEEINETIHNHRRKPQA